MSDIAIRAEQVSKKFARSLKRAMTYGLIDIARAALIPHRFRSDGFDARLADSTGRNPLDAPLKSEPQPLPALRPTEFWALQNVSFELKKGECLGVVGHNGAGKSTLLSILCGIYGPTRGRVLVHGRLQALIALGAGFHPMLSGRENIYLSAAIYGMRGREIDRIYSQVVDFSELHDFIDMPIKNYSSGMLVRLGFSAAIHLQPDILIVDEVLAVGDYAFRLKCNERMSGIVNSGIPIILVSHVPQTIEVMASTVMWLDHGQVREQGDTKPVMERYQAFMRAQAGKRPQTAAPSAQTLSPILIRRVELLDDSGRPRDAFAWNETIVFRVHYACKESVVNPYIGINVKKGGVYGGIATRLSMCDDGYQWTCPPGDGYVDCVLPRPSLTHGAYQVWGMIQRSPTTETGLVNYQDPFHATDFEVRADSRAMNLPGVMHTLREHLPAIMLPHDWKPHRPD